jgi:hypothetical protein
LPTLRRCAYIGVSTQVVDHTTGTGANPMIRSLLAGAMALGQMICLAQAQAEIPPRVYDGHVVPVDENCAFDTPIAWRATYRPYISDALSGHMPSQLVVFTDVQNAHGFRVANLPSGDFNPTQLRGDFVIPLVAVIALGDVADKDMNSNAGNIGQRNGTFTQDPNLIRPDRRGRLPTYVKITGTIVKDSDGGPGLACASEIRGVFVLRPVPAAAPGLEGGDHDAND